MRSSRKRPTAKGKGSTFTKLMVYAPIALEVLNMLNNRQKKKRGKYVKARKRDKAFDFLLDKANRYIDGKKPQKRRWF